MFNKIMQRLLGNNTERELKKMWPIVHHINDLEPKLTALSDSSLQEKTFEFKRRLAEGETLDDILPEAFAVVREASRRVLGMRHFDVQLLGGIVLHRGDIAEMRTGEGKTLVATLPVYLNALTGKGVHVVTVNDYLATRDSEEMGQIYKFLGLSVGLIVHDLTYEQRRRAYNSDITYGTNNEFGFDYLRDNMVISKDQMVQRPLNYCIVDEVDSILIDEARTPLIISGPGEKSTDLYYTLAHIVKTFEKEDYTMDEKQKTIAPTESGVAKVEKMLGIKNMFDNDHLDLNHLVIQALRARFMMHRDKDYVVKDGEIVIVDEFTGRLMFGRRYSDGLHQSIEAKENVKVQGESKTLATITFQNYFRMYDKLAGMTGTAKTEEDEFNKIYKLDVYVIPTNKPAIRKDLPDVIYKTKHAKYRAVVREVKKRHETGQPILVGTTSISQSEIISQLLKKENIVHNVLNAKYHEKEAEIIKDAGQMNMVTIATNMAGRGTDIKLGKGVAELGGLMIIGTERHESRRIDNQLRGRAGRQGDPGTTQFFLSLEDDLMRIFGSENISKFMDKLGMDEDEPITHSMITRSIEKAQKKVESHNFEIRKYVLEYDDVMNQQREVLYGQRRKVLVAESLRDTILGMVDDIILDGLDRYADEKLYPEEWDFAGLLAQMEQYFVPKGTVTVEELENLSRIEVQEKLKDIAVALYDEREKEISAETMRELEKAIMLRVVDSKWMDHLDAMDALKEGINLRAYGQKNPLVEYKFEAYEMFEEMIDSIKRTVITFLYHIQVTYSKPVPKAEDRLQGATEVHEESKPVSREDIEREEQRKQQQQD
ncbi:preprotein translocase subunit SecA [Megasphaera sp. ASD88]|uniref:Protein translocase subunit SecA n=2 Tax=Megasphaera TaxID=906 RepID=A0A346B206_9FIRM|nr:MULTISPECIES: preprotein translocase subunit SecA [Megasphaera]MDN0046079.1 preprotein translocase subunit SecA [Megasphaera hexanoica]NJE34519.1 preprotein translocase subunit SecA [Megasphaera sp. SW808]SCJ16876.1 preprotein translocase subunit SecA [uncultured Ruminococcus sp.]AXL22149.1 preprotein translocase subunit SecA [Megasphaera stantonii]MBM6732349.1 preprotein translocase subunit SecA [Megasphaera stantonii]